MKVISNYKNRYGFVLCIEKIIVSYMQMFFEYFNLYLYLTAIFNLVNIKM